jgi:hypothetical protein
MAENQIKVDDYIYENEELVAVKTQQFGELKISHWRETLLGSFSGVEFKLPQKDGAFLKFIPSHFHLSKKGVVQSMPSYWRYGIFVKDKEENKAMITRCYYHFSEEKTEKHLPFGKTIVGTVEIKKSFNSKTKEEKIIVNFYCQEKNQEKKYRVAIGSNSEKKSEADIAIPGLKSKIKVFKI